MPGVSSLGGETKMVKNLKNSMHLCICVCVCACAHMCVVYLCERESSREQEQRYHGVDACHKSLHNLEPKYAKDLCQWVQKKEMIIPAEMVKEGFRQG